MRTFRSFLKGSYSFLKRKSLRYNFYVLTWFETRNHGNLGLAYAAVKGTLNFRLDFQDFLKYRQKSPEFSDYILIKNK